MERRTFELPAGASPALVAYHHRFVADRNVQLAAEDAHAEAHAAARAASVAAGVGWVMSLPVGHVDRVAWEEALAARDAVRRRDVADLKRLGAALSPAEAEDYRARQRAWYFSDANALHPDENLSPSGRYKLVVTKHPTEPGAWAYSRGRVYRRGDDAPIATIERNFGAFPFSWIEGHGLSGRDFLVAGSDYQGQTFIDLVDGSRRDHRSAGAERGVGFCWARHHPSPDGTLLAVEGCVWAAPYELHIYDLSDPLSTAPPRLLANVGEYAEVHGWTSARTFAVDRVVRRVGLEGHPWHGREVDGLTDDEERALEAAGAAQGMGPYAWIAEVVEAGFSVTV